MECVHKWGALFPLLTPLPRALSPSAVKIKVGLAVGSLALIPLSPVIPPSPHLQKAAWSGGSKQYVFGDRQVWIQIVPVLLFDLRHIAEIL